MKMNMVVSECLVEESKERADVLVACESVMTPGRLDFPDRPCLGCGSKEHFSSVCYEKNILKHKEFQSTFGFSAYSNGSLIIPAAGWAKLAARPPFAALTALASLLQRSTGAA